MKKLLAVALLGALVFALVPAEATHNPRSVSGTVLAPTVTVPAVGTFSRQARCAYLLAGAAANGLVGWVDTLDAAEGDGLHTFTLGGTGADWAVVFYEDLGTCDGVTGGGPLVTDDFFNPGDEAGTIPEFSAFAIIVFEGTTPNSSFTFSIA